MSVGLNLLVARNANPVQWVEEVSDGGATHYVFGDLDQKTTALGVRVNYAVSPTLSVRLYGRPFVSTGNYGRYSELVDGRAPRFEDRYAPYAYNGDSDFRYRSFRMTNVVRWEFRPGSTLFVVWQQGREDEDSNVADARSLGGSFNAPATNVVLVKVAYWINP